MLQVRLLRVLSFLVLSVVRFVLAWAHSHNITLESTAPAIIWSPALCNVSLNDSNCTSAWRVSEDVLGAEITSTNGPDSVTGDIIPQMFLSFRGSAIYIRTSPQSTATVNVSFSSPSVAMHTDAQVNSSIGWISAINLSEDVAFTITITYVPNFGSQDGDGGRLDIQFIILTVSNISAISSFLPSMALPSSSTLPISSPSQVLTTTPSTRRQSKGAIIGESVGSALGGILLVSAGIAFVFWRQKRRRERIKSNEWVWGDLQMERLTIK